MAPAALDRVAETAGSEAAGHTADVVREVIGLLPWSASLPAEDFGEMLVELREAALIWQHTRDLSELERLTLEWKATAEAYRDGDFLRQLGRSDKNFVVWK